MMRRRPARAALAALAVLALLVLAALSALSVRPASAAGTGGIEVTPVPSMRDGRAVTTFTALVPASGSVQVPFTLRNLDKAVRSARVYTAEVTRSDGNFTLGGGGSPYASMPDRTVTLAPGAVERAFFTVSAGPGRPSGKVYAAVVVEVRNGSVVTRASTLVYLSPGSAVPVPLLLVLIAVALLLLAGTAVVRLRPRR